MKRLDKLIFLSFAGSFLATFFISVFFFLLLFIFVYIDDFVGKGIGGGAFLRLFFYSSLNTIPRALPLSLLLAAVMAMGRLSGNLEITALYSAGISFNRIMRPLILTGLCSMIFLFAFSELILPAVNMQAQELLAGIRSARPVLLFHEGEFNNRIPGYSIRIAEIDEKTNKLGGILIYDHSQGEGNATVCSAESGEIENMEGTLKLHLHNGASYKEMPASEDLPLIREEFQDRTYTIPLKGFGLQQHAANSFSKDYDLMRTAEMKNFCDSLKTWNKAALANGSASQLRLLLNEDLILKYTIEWHKRFRDAVACLLMILVGGPVGFQIRRGGLGMPLVFSVVIYILYHAFSVTGEKLAEDGSIPAAAGAWFPIVVTTIPALLIYFITLKGKRPGEGISNRFLKKK